MLYLGSENEIVSAETLIKRFNLQDLMPKSDKVDSIVFEQIGVKFDPSNPDSVRKINVDKDFSVITEDGDTLMLRHSTVKAQFLKGETVWTDRKYLIDRRTFRLSLKKDKELIVFLMLNPANEDSPIRQYNPGRKVYYRVQNLAKQAADQNKTIQLKKEAFNIIYAENQSEENLRQIAAGMGVANTHIMGLDELQGALALQAETNPHTFMSRWNSHDVAFKGMIQVAKDRGLIIQKEVARVKRWYLNNDEICIIGNHDDANQTLEQALVDGFDTWMPKIKKALTGYNTSDKIKQGMDELASKAEESVKDKVMECIGADILYFDRADGTLYTLKDGEKNKEVLTVSDKSNWLNEIVDYYEQNKQSLNGLYLAARKKIKKADADNA